MNYLGSELVFLEEDRVNQEPDRRDRAVRPHRRAPDEKALRPDRRPPVCGADFYARHF